MRATGIIRRIDDLGRVVIPKEIRRVFNVREGDPLEIFMDKENGLICFAKYETSLIPQLTALADNIDEAMVEESETTTRRMAIRNHFNEIAKLLKEFEES